MNKITNNVLKVSGIVIGVFFSLGAIVILALVWHVSKQSASEKDLTDEFDKIMQVDSEIIESNFTSGNCYDVCSGADRKFTIRPVSDYSKLFDDYVSLLGRHGYTVSTDKSDFLNDNYDKGEPHPYYLTIQAGNSDLKYYLDLELYNSSIPSSLGSNGRTAPASVNAAYAYIKATK